MFESLLLRNLMNYESNKNLTQLVTPVVDPLESFGSVGDTRLHPKRHFLQTAITGKTNRSRRGGGVV